MPRGAVERMERLRSSFDAYPQLSDVARRRLVTDARQWLFELRHRLEPSAPMAPPRLKLQTASGPQPNERPSLDLESPITRIKGVGPKLASRLASACQSLAAGVFRR